MERQVGLPRWRRRDGLLLGAACVCVVRACAALRGEGDDDAGGRGRQADSGWAWRGREDGGEARERGGADEAAEQAAEAGGLGWAPVSRRPVRCSSSGGRGGSVLGPLGSHRGAVRQSGRRGGT
ncbi:hypothetical protein PVAP13_2KG512000 [Panicum virgatum]|uniref:Uncharacterized protein n=1 Tax=Panicum virgatum TaxID=38727 RepID=A0A8T0WH20_PANVG|nr:hypothetical protein PVAP13_2KG512000 [Panicum virgatum]